MTISLSDREEGELQGHPERGQELRVEHQPAELLSPGEDLVGLAPNGFQ